MLESSACQQDEPKSTQHDQNEDSGKSKEFTLTIKCSETHIAKLLEIASALEERWTPSTWVPPQMSKGLLNYTVKDIGIPIKEHIILDELIVNMYQLYTGPWPSPEAVIDSPLITTSILLLVIGTTWTRLPLKPEWEHTRNVYALAEQEVVRRYLAKAVEYKAFERARSLGLWYEGY
ncbi:hypothetical protein CERSUDRAFT_116639 [Gelatoporia subvermispora B]|uniref:Uncharacterized protein n=1 Tax=Ceriporiopsis subvermispora (strain B) TaxID=914234 RepID=M2R9P9_CERS8|nr:hypothetical protein CERSUDRAFT_116639 [Gelatoporia subvermispora B]